jgi:hypothetical protein
VPTRFLLPVLSLLLCACAVTNPQTVQEEVSDTERRCCAQCGDAASKDPAGRDISLDLCAGYSGYVVNGQAPLDAACGDWFKAHPHTVADCR